MHVRSISLTVLVVQIFLKFSAQLLLTASEPLRLHQQFNTGVYYCPILPVILSGDASYRC
jgi:hypothetical protein